MPDSNALKLTVRPVTTLIQFGEVAYVDPLLPTAVDHDVEMVKHFRHSYQDEHRFVLRPPKSVPKLEPVDLEIGPICDLAMLVTL